MKIAKFGILFGLNSSTSITGGTLSATNFVVDLEDVAAEDITSEEFTQVIMAYLKAYVKKGGVFESGYFRGLDKP